MDGSSIYTWFAWIMKHKINFMNDVCLLFNQYDYACSCDYIFRAQKSPLELWAFMYCSYLLAFFDKMLFIQSRLRDKTDYLCNLNLTNALSLWRRLRTKIHMCYFYLRFEWNNKLQKNNGSHTNSYFWVCFFSPHIFFSLHPLTLIKLPILFEGVFHVQDYSLFFHVQC